MKKTKLIAIIFLVVFIFMGVVYASWTEMLNINNTAITGNFNVVFEEDTILNNTNKDQYVNVTATPVSGDPHTLNVNISNIYPGAGGGFCYKIINRGTIPAKFESITWDALIDQNRLDRDKILDYTISLQKYKDLTPLSGLINRSAVSVSTLNQTLNQAFSNWNNTGRALVLNPGEYVILGNQSGESVVAGYFVTMKSNATEYQNATVSFNLKIKFKQWNK